MDVKKYKNKEELLDSLIKREDSILDVGFWGQGVSIDDDNWPHRILKNRVDNIYGLDIVFDESKLENPENYFKASAENFNLEKKFDVIFAGDLIEHLSNPGLFLKSAKRHLNPGGRIIITTPNAFNLFVIAGKLANFEPVVNHDHTCYFNSKTMKTLLNKNDLELSQLGYVYTLGVKHKESLKKKILNFIYKIFSKFTPKYFETMVVVSKVD